MSIKPGELQRFERLISRWATSFKGKAYLTIGLPVLYFPSLVYRFSLKSTAWLYLPLIYIAYLPTKLRDAKGIQVWVGYVGRSLLDWFRFAMAFVVLAVAMIAATDWQAWGTLVNAAKNNEVLVTALSFLLVLDGNKFEPWHWVSLPAAILTIFLFFRFDILRKRMAAGEALDYTHWTMRGTIVLSQTRNFLCICWIALALYGFFALAHTTCKLPLWSAPLLSWQFGSAACVGS